ncbi:hypothetical protein GGI1_02922, partial [Acidithiobacillus sp. GGI-221]
MPDFNAHEHSDITVNAIQLCIQTILRSSPEKGYHGKIIIIDHYGYFAIGINNGYCRPISI